MGSSSRFWAASGGFLLAVATGLAAWHAHGLAEDLAEEEHVAFGRALLQQFVTGAGLLGLGAWIRLREGDRLLDVAAGLLLVGCLLFCGEVYRGALGQETWGLAPKGGGAMILAWLLAAGALLRRH